MVDKIFEILRFLLTPEAIAAYIIGALVIYFGVRQLSINLKLNKKSGVFDELSSELQKAGDLVVSIDHAANKIISDFANEADRITAIDTSQLQGKALRDELKRREEARKNIEKARLDHLNTVFDSSRDVLTIIRKIEKSTLVGNQTKAAARHLFFVTRTQHELEAEMIKLLKTLDLTANETQSPNVTPETFTAIKDLFAEVNKGNERLQNFLDDLEVILHNDLVKSIHGEASYPHHPDERLTPGGIIDKRTDIPLV